MSRRLLTFREAAEALGWVDDGATDAQRDAAGRRLRWAVMAREQQTGKRIATRLGVRGDRQPKARITLGALSRHLPELQPPKAVELRSNFDAYLASIDDKIGELAAEEITRLVEPQIRELHEKFDGVDGKAETALRQLEALAARVAKLAQHTPGKSPVLTRTDDAKP